MTVKQVTKFNGRYTGAMSGFIDLTKSSEQILGKINSGEVFIYMFRRFGYPRYGWDDQKTLVKYNLTTSMAGVVLTVQPDVTGGGTFGYLIREDLDKLCMDEDDMPSKEWHNQCENWVLKEHGIEIIKIFEQDLDKLQRVWKIWGADNEDKDFIDEQDANNQFFEDQVNIRVKYVDLYQDINPFPKTISIQDRNDSSIIKQCYTALCDAIEDLKRIVYVRDVPINIRGEIKYLDYVDDDVIEYSNMAGIGVGDKLDADLNDEVDCDI